MASSGRSTSAYSRRKPEETVLYQLVEENWDAFRAQVEAGDASVPFHIAKEFDGFLRCGVLAHGFLRLKCSECRHEKFVAFSCKKRGFCSSCGAKRMSESAAYWTDHIFPHVPVRQWVVSLPIPLRFWMAKNPELLNRVLSICIGAIERTCKNKAKELGSGAGVHPGAITYVQRFGGAINLNIHFHILFLEGVYVEKPGEPGSGGVEFCEVAISHEDVEATIRRIQSRVIRLLVRRRLLAESEDDASLTLSGLDEDMNQDSIVDAVQGASAQSLIAMGERAGQPVRRVGSFGGPGEPIVPEGLRCVRVGGFSLHANVEIEARARGKLEKLCRYLARPPVAENRLELGPDGQVLYHMKNEWRDGTRAILLSPMEFIEKLVAIIPPPRRHLARFHGVLAPNSRLREKVVPKTAAAEIITEHSKPPEVESPMAKQKRLKWAELSSSEETVPISVD